MAVSSLPFRDFFYPHEPVVTYLSDELITKQEFKAECDINNIISQYQQTGIINHISQHQAAFIDLPNEFDYQSSLNLIIQAQESFDQLPAVVRDHFENDPERFLSAFGDESQHDQLRRWGLLKPLREPDPGPPPASPASEPSS